jgi:hypothetical protein
MEAISVMQKSEVKWIVALLALIGVYVLLFHNRFAREQMTIHPSLRPSRQADATVFSVFFALNDDFKLTSVKVIPFQGENFNPLGRAVWHLISDSNSVPIRAFGYGQRIKGMKPALQEAQPEPLEAGVVYRLLVEAGSVKAFTDFRARGTDE